MSRIKSKQVEGAVDTFSSQEVTGQKTFSSAQAFTGGVTAVVISEGYIYWAMNPQNLDEDGNSRMRIENGQMQIEVFQGGWMPV